MPGQGSRSGVKVRGQGQGPTPEFKARGQEICRGQVEAEG